MLLDPQTGLAVVSLLIQIIEGGIKLTSKTRELYHSEQGALKKHQRLEAEAQALVLLADRVSKDTIDGENLNDHDPLTTDLLNICTRCTSAGKELIAALGKLKITGDRSRLSSLKQVLRIIWEEKKVEQLSKNLDNLRKQFDTALHVDARQKLSESAARLRDRIEEILARLMQSLDLNPEAIASVDRTTSLEHYEEYHDPSVPLGDSLSHVPTELLEARLLSRLRRHKRSDCYADITVPHQRRFCSILYTTGELASSKLNLSKWLRHENGVCRIGGKAGSGKSVQMKSIYDDSKCRDLLTAWADQLPLVLCASFLDASMINSTSGWTDMLGTLLYTVLAQRPGLAALVFPDHFQNVMKSSNIEYSFSDNVLEDAFRRLVAQDGKFFRLCCFIDGLDALKENHAKVFDFFKDLLSSSKIKICISSRNVVRFEDAFSQDPQFQLEAVSSANISEYVKTKLRGNPRFNDLIKTNPLLAQRIRARIEINASSCFTAVLPLVESVLEALAHGARPAELSQFDEGTSATLTALHQDMFNQIKPEYLKEAAHLFKLVELSCGPLTLLQLSFVYETPEYIRDMHLRSLDKDEIRERCDSMRRFVSSRSNGLLERTPPCTKHSAQPPLHATAEEQTCSPTLELISDGIPRPNDRLEALPNAQQRTSDSLSSSTNDLHTVFDAYIQYHHPSANTFLQEAEAATMLNPLVKLENVYGALLRSYLAMLKLIPPSEDWHHKMWHIVVQFLLCASAAEHLTKLSTTSLLGELDSTCTRIFRSQHRKEQVGTPTRSYYTHTSGRNYRLDCRKNRKKKHWTSTAETGRPGSNILCLAISTSLFSYVEIKAPLLRQLVDGADESLLLYTISDCFPASTSSGKRLLPSKPDVEMARLLLKYKADPFHGHPGMTPWDYVILNARNASYQSEASNTESSEKQIVAEDAYSKRMEAWAQMVEMFLTNRTLPLRHYYPSIAANVEEIFDKWDPQEAQRLARLVETRTRRWRMLSHLQKFHH